MSVSPPWWIPDHCDALRQAVGRDAVLSRPRIGRLPITRGRSSEVVITLAWPTEPRAPFLDESIHEMGRGGRMDFIHCSVGMVLEYFPGKMTIMTHILTRHFIGECGSCA